MASKEQKLIIAAGEGKVSKVKKLLQKGLFAGNVDVNAKDKFNWSALMKAAWRGHTEIASLLIAAGADVSPILETAARDGNTTVLRVLQEAGADLDARDESGDTALVRAARNGQTQIVKALLDAGADASKVDLKEIIDNGHSETVKLLTGLVII